MTWTSDNGAQKACSKDLGASGPKARTHLPFHSTLFNSSFL